MTWTTVIRCTNHKIAPAVAEPVFLELTRAAGGDEQTARDVDDNPRGYDDGRRTIMNEPAGLSALVGMHIALETPLNWFEADDKFQDGNDHLAEWFIDTPYSAFDNQEPIVERLIAFINAEGLDLEDFSWAAFEVQQGWWPLTDFPNPAT